MRSGSELPPPYHHTIKRVVRALILYEASVLEHLRAHIDVQTLVTLDYGHPLQSKRKRFGWDMFEYVVPWLNKFSPSLVTKAKALP